MGTTAEALNYDYDVIDTPSEPTTDKIVRCFTDSELKEQWDGYRMGGQE